MRPRRLLALAVALIIPVQAAAQATDDVTYYHLDALGSVRAITDANQQVVATYDYLPFGEAWPNAGTSTNMRRFAGKDRDAETAFEYVGARYYASQMGRFTTVDPALDLDQALVDPQRWNRYGYALNNPLKYTDPDGRSATLVGGLVGGVLGGGIALIQGGSWREVGAAAAGGAVSGAMLGSVIDTGGASLPVLLGAGAMVGIEGRLVENAINGRSTTAQDAALSGLAGTAGVAAGEIMIVGAQAMARTGAAGIRATLTNTADLEATHGITMSGRDSLVSRRTSRRMGSRNPSSTSSTTGGTSSSTVIIVYGPPRRLECAMYRHNGSTCRTQAIEHR